MSKAKKALLQELGQTHLFDGWGSKPSAADESRFYKQIEDLDASYPGGLKAYVDNGRKLLADSKAGVNPLEGWTPSVPVGETVAYGTPEFDEVEAAGMAAVSGGGCGFVLVAGGLGERLGYSGIKVQLPTQLTTGTTYLELYIRHILALQGSGAPLPLAIMTSGDTDAQTRALLDANANFGMRAGQVTIVRQEKVACLADNDARLAADPKDPYKLLTKPHG
ncbi:DP-N-acetylglucosamine pyrophosphorylase [Emiliania huxleyi CCMP1516]|nr:DP-N-acetylglucosamine pyrophosphorylase [Emiliania huxleyi CCMP1516]EOD31900.1 DP-N-acetylglucosamine pyrophosphorylase [Emiliania huxleyi CCMP1516]|eukprot:XP_005784329.1 DP-N-acetylglucosamine pyrophosphorylase [Emiliania huxleyi CCMP1516]